MSGHDDELLSAYIDGELSNKDRSAVKQRLAEDVAAREALEELSDTSALVRSLPRSSAPRTLHDDVLAQLRASRPANPAARPSRRRQVIWLASSAATLLLAVVLYRNWPDPQEPLIADGRDFGEMGSVADSDSDFGIVMDRFHRTAEVPPTASAVMDESAAVPDGQSDPLFAQPWGTTQVALNNSFVLQDNLNRALVDGATPVVGEGIEQLAEIGGQVVILRYRVVDKLDMLGTVQLVLSNNGIDPVDENVSNEALAQLQVANGDLHAIYLESPPPTFTAAVNELNDLDNCTTVITNTVAFVQDELTLNLALADQNEVRESPPARTMRESLSRAESKDVSENGALTTQLPASPEVDFVPADSRLTRGEPAEQPASRSAMSSRNSPSVPQSGEESNAASGAELAKEEDVDAYQVVVPARRELLLELETLQNRAIDDLARDQRGTLGETAKREKQVQRQHWYFPAPPQQGPVASNRVRAVILLVPEQPENPQSPDP